MNPALGGLPDLPDDLAEAFEDMKLAIMHHRLDGWREIAERDVLTMLAILVELTEEPND